MRSLNPDEPVRLGGFRFLVRSGSGGPAGSGPGPRQGRRALLRLTSLVGVVVLIVGAGLYAFAAQPWDPTGAADSSTDGCSASSPTFSDRFVPPQDPQVTFAADVPLELSFSPDGSVLAVSQVDTVTLWDWQESRVLAQIDHGSSAVPPTPAAFSPDGCLIAYGTPDGAVVTDLATGQQQTVGAQETVRSVAFNPDGSSLAVGVQSDPDGRLLHLHDTGTWELKARLSGSAGLGSIKYSFDGSVLAGGENGGGIAVWNTEAPGGTELVRDRTGVGAGAFDIVPDGSAVLLIRSGAVHLVDPETEKVLREFVPDTDEGILVDVAYSAASGRVFAARLDPITNTGGMVAWRYSAATEVPLGPDLPSLFPIALSEEGSRVAGLRAGTGDIAVYNTELSLVGVITG